MGNTRILILATDIYTRGGVARYTATLADALSGLPANVDVLPLLGDSRLRGDDAPAESYRIMAPITREVSAPAKVRHTIRALRQARSGYDLVICSHLSQAPIAAVIRLRHDTPYMVVAHGSEAWAKLSIFKRLAVRGACRVLAVSAYTARAMTTANRISPRRVKVIYNAVSEDIVGRLTMPGPGARCSSRTLLSVASLKPEHGYKGVDTVIQALPQIAASVPDVRYVVAGAGEDRGRLERLASARGVRDRVTFAGEVSDAELANLFRACDVFVLPSRASQRKGHRWEGEGFGRVYLEAAFAGKPVVGSKDGGAAEAVLDGRTGLQVEPRSVTQVASAAIRLLQSPAWATSLGSEGRQWALERFTVDAMRKSLEGVLSSVVRCPFSVVRGPSPGRVRPTTNALPPLTTDNGQLTRDNGQRT